MTGGQAIAPLLLERRPIEVVHAIRRHNCDRGCIHQMECPPLSLVLARVEEEIPELVDDGVRVHCRGRVVAPVSPSGLRGAEEPSLFDLGGLS